MNGEIPSVPITTLAGVSSLVDLLPEMPLPSPLPQTLSNKSLLFHPRVAEEAQRLLVVNDDNLVSQLVQCLSQTSSRNIDLKDQIADIQLDHENSPSLLGGILQRKPDVFKGKHVVREEHVHLSPHSLQLNQSNHTNQHMPSPHSQLMHSASSQLGESSSQSLASAHMQQLHSQMQLPQSPMVMQQSAMSLHHPGHVPGSQQGHVSSLHMDPLSQLTMQSTALQNAVYGQLSHPNLPLPLPQSSPGHSQLPVHPPSQMIQNCESFPHLRSQQSPSSTATSLTHSFQQLPELSNQSSQLQQDFVLEPAKPILNPPSYPNNKTDKANPSPLPQLQVQLKPLDPTQLKQFGHLLDQSQHSSDEQDRTNFKSEGQTLPEQRKQNNTAAKSTPTKTLNNKSNSVKSNQVKQEPEQNVYEEPKKKIRRVERMLVPVLEKMDANILDNSTYHRFLKLMDLVLDSVDDCDRDDMEDEDGNVPSEYLISKHQLSELCAEAAKLKALGAMASMPHEKIVRLLTIMEKNIRNGTKVTPLADPDDNEEESKLWIELSMESINRGVLASLTSLHILTSANIPKKAYLEELIDRIAIFTKFQLQNTIFPSFDPVYRIDRKSKAKDGFSSSKKKRAHAAQVRDKSMKSFYNKIHELVGLLADLLNVQVLTDTTVLHLSTLGVSPFFVENVSELQLSALKLVTNIFTQYEKHRRLLLDDILASIARLPSSKRGLRTFKLASSDECIQMLTALVLQLIQCVTSIPDHLGSKLPNSSEAEEPSATDKDVIIVGKYETAFRTAGSFLQVFLSKCGSKSEDCDYKVLFENFVQDLLSTVNKPQWPAAELLLSLLGTLLVKNLTNKNCEVSLRVASLDYLGLAASRLRKDAVTTQLKVDTIDKIIADIRSEEEQFGESKEPLSEAGTFDAEEEKIKYLQRLLLDYLAVHGQSDPSLLLARHFYITNWWKSAAVDITSRLAVSRNQPKTTNRSKRKRKRKGESSGEDSFSESENENDDGNEKEELNNKVLELSQKRKEFLVSKIRPFSDPLSSRKTKVVQTFIDYQSAELITRYLASQRPFSATFDTFLKRILSVACEQTVAIRTKALKCLTMVVEADPNVLARPDMHMWVENSFLDQSTAVREAAVDLVGKYVLSCHDLIDKYYATLSLRILDTGVSVRKRVIKILRDICVECPSFPKIPEICVKMIRRVNDEEGIRKLVMEVFQNLWFTPVKENPLDTESLLRKVSHITEVVASCETVGLDFFEQLLLSLFKPKDDKDDVREKTVNLEPPKAVVTASTQIVNCLVDSVLRLEESSSSNHSNRFVACVATLYLFAKIRPELLVNHAITLEGYLSLRCQNQAEFHAVANIGNILEVVVPLLVNPSETFLSQLEEDCVKLIMKSNERGIIESCLACFGSVVNKITHNYSLVRDVFRRFQIVLVTQTNIIRTNLDCSSLPDGKPQPENRPFLRKTVYVIGLFLRYFDFTSADVYGDFPADIVAQMFNNLMFIVQLPQDDNMKNFSLQALGNLCVRHYNFLLESELKTIYHQLLTTFSETKLKVQTLNNIQLYLTEEELRMIKQDQEWNKHGGKMENIKEMGDVTSGMASTIVQIYLKQILNAFLHSDVSVRLASVRVIQLVLQQGLVHPIQIVPYLICMSTDPEQSVSSTADKQLQEMEKKHPQFLQSQVLNGIRLSLQLQRILQGYTGNVINGAMHIGSLAELGIDLRHNVPIVRGYRQRPKEIPISLNGFLYSLLRSTKPQRRAVALSLLKQFDDSQKNGLADLLYFADNLAYFPYQVVDEPLFIIHHVDIVISVTGSNLLQAFKESLIPLHPKIVESESHTNVPLDPDNPVPTATPEPIKITDIMEDDEDEDDIESLVTRVPEDTTTLEECIISSQGCLLLLMLKQHLKDSYGITDSRISGYSPSDATKTYERPVNRKITPPFDPKCTLANLNLPPSGATPESRLQLVEQYIHFKQLMLRIDPEDGDEDGETKPVKIKIDQNMFQYPKARPISGKEKVDMETPSSASGTSSAEVSPIKLSTNMGPGGQYACIVQASNSTPVNKVEPVVRVPKLTIVPLKFPGTEGKREKSHHKEHKLKDHNHHHKYKKSKHKKKKRYAVSDDDDSDNPESDPDFHL